MREIKFRAWNLDEKRMEYGDGIFKFTGVIHVLVDYIKSPAVHGTKIATMFNGKLMQFTGLKDKNGKEIYEGDIVKSCSDSCPEDAEDEKHIQVIKWDKSGGYISSFNCGFEFDPLIGNDDIEHEIIGNIYENPDLITP